MFHYFASNNDEVIELIHKKYMDAKENGQLTDADRHMPLVILSPDKDSKTAIDIAIKNKRLKSMELMLDLLEDFPSHSLSKMMLNSIPYMVS